MIRRIRRWMCSRKFCNQWDPPPGAGRDTHICLLPRKHGVHHRCKCGHRWTFPQCGDETCTEDHG